MRNAEIIIRLLPDADEGTIREAAIQQDFHWILNSIRAASLSVEAVSYSEKSVDGATRLIGEFIVPLMAASSAIWMFIGTWLQSKSGRRVRLKVGDLEVEAHSISEVEKLFNLVATEGNLNTDTTTDARTTRITSSV